MLSLFLQSCLGTNRQPVSVCVTSEQECSENNGRNGCIKPVGSFEDQLLQCGQSADGEWTRSCKLAIKVGCDGEDT